MFEGMFDPLIKLVKWGFIILVVIITGLVLYIVFGK